MSGHSKWHTTKRHKAVIGAKPGKKIQLINKESYDDSMEVIISHTKVFLSKEVSRNILVTA